MLTTLYLGMMWLAWVYDPDSDRTLFFLLRPTKSERLVLILVMCIELGLFLAYCLLHWLYPLLIDSISETWLAKHWFRLQYEGDGWFRYVPYGIFTPRTWRRCRYTGSTDREGRPHGTGEWRDDSFHGECLMGRFCHGEPVGPFRAREFGSGSLSVQTFIMYATSRAEEDIRETHFTPSRSIDGMRFGVVGVECCSGGDFYAHLPQVTDRVGEETRDVCTALRTLKRSLTSASSPSRGGGNTLTSRLEDEDRRVTAHLWPNRGLEIHGGYECNARVKVVGRSVFLLEPIPMTTPSSEALVFLHGYNCPTEYALLRLGQMLALGSFPAHIHPFVFSQATGQTFSYIKAKECIGQFAGDLLDFLLDLRRRGYHHVHCLVHSMAAHLFFMMLEEYENRRLLDPESTEILKLANVVLINADFPLTSFEEVHVPRVLEVADRLTMYCDDRDFALLCSEVCLRDKVVGRKIWPVCARPSGSLPYGRSRIDVMDCRHMQQNVHSIRHNYFNLNVQIVSDIAELVTDHCGADQRLTRTVRQVAGENVFSFLCPPNMLWSGFLREVADDVRGFASQLHRDVCGDLDYYGETPSTDDASTDSESLEGDCIWEGMPFGAINTVDVLTCRSEAKSGCVPKWRYMQHNEEEELTDSEGSSRSTSFASSCRAEATVQTDAGYVEELEETVAALEVSVSWAVRTIDLIPAHQYLQTVTFGDSPLTVQEAGYHNRQLDPRGVKGTSKVLEEVLSKRKAEQSKSASKKNPAAAKKKKAKASRPVSGAELREKLHAKIEAMREARETQKEWKKAAKENEENAVDAGEAKRLRRAKEKAAAAERRKKGKNGGRKKGEMKAAVAAKRKEREAAAAADVEEQAATVKEDLDFSSFNFKKRAADVEEYKEKKVSKRQRLDKEIQQAEKEQQQIAQAATAEERVKLSQDKAIERAMKRAAGEKVHDDVHKLRKAQKTIDKKKNKSREEWAARTREVKDKQAAEQAKRKENIQKYRGKNARKSLAEKSNEA
ncbi:hypothetical protein FOL47_001157 [Perkinsus chesapeaki]|uniref:Ribosomal RNA-processing protein 14/surfeit locus protein 6 C-terminal domain-containing protein n=1 Tax=Perkinsus chesapeaki TaxID=330153 RepID=A0A7J6MJS8_PERCH|nr:hypothetical protein FOL47_001157 [Perkinsus chesapeaki]